MAHRILVALDDSPHAWNALDHALAKFQDDDLVAIHVNDPMEWIYTDDMGGYYSEDSYERAQESAAELLSQASERAEAAGVDIETVTETGKPAQAIIKYAGENDVDHIVMGSHGRRGLSRILLGSVAETVVKRSPVSVTIIRSPDEE